MRFLRRTKATINFEIITLEVDYFHFAICIAICSNASLPALESFADSVPFSLILSSTIHALR